MQCSDLCSKAPTLLGIAERSVRYPINRACLEEPYGEVNQLFGTIIRDTRHRDVELISCEPMESAYFDAWHMRLVDLHDLPKQPREFIAAKSPNRQGGIEIPERLHEVYALLLDAKALCLTTPWEKPKTR